MFYGTKTVPVLILKLHNFYMSAKDKQS